MFSTAFIGSLLCLDVAAVGQFMFSRPVVAGSLIGWLLGNIEIGLLTGILVELLWINVIPIGASIPPDATIVTILTAYWVFPFDRASDVGMALSLAIPAGIAFKKSDLAMRKRFALWNRKIEEKISSKKDPGFLSVIFCSILLTFLKSFLFLTLLLPLGKGCMRVLHLWKGLPSFEFMVPAAATLGFAMLADTFGRRDRFL